MTTQEQKELFGLTALLVTLFKFDGFSIEVKPSDEGLVMAAKCDRCKTVASTLVMHREKMGDDYIKREADRFVKETNNHLH